MQGAWLAVLVGILGTAVLLNTGNILTFIGQNPRTAGIALDCVLVFALGFSGAATTVAAWAREDGDRRALRDLRSALLTIGLCYSAGLSVIILASSGFITRVLFGLHGPRAESMVRELLPTRSTPCRWDTWWASRTPELPRSWWVRATGSPVSEQASS
ncbi:hypothetical protein [Streptomyces sp. NPDC018347]|uniref:hypothetical protein n=1 Tax=Streptomyces sp. NPDC018347 TaxID=3157193 RepID=UPI0033EF2302